MLNEYDIKTGQSAIIAAKFLENGVNGKATLTGEIFCKYMLSYAHRYLCNEFFFQVIMKFIGMAASLNSNRYDARNYDTIRTCKYIVEKLERAWVDDGVSLRVPKSFTDEEFYELYHNVNVSSYGTENMYDFSCIQKIIEENVKLKNEIEELKSNGNK